jgi:YD repeat-containing protein
MTASTTLHSKAFNFLSYVETGTDPRTGLYTCTISLPTLKANNLCGPDVPVQLRFSPLNANDSGYGLGWDMQLSQYNPFDNILSLSTGETFKVTGTGLEPGIGEKKLDNFHFFNDGNGLYRVVHKSGLVEILSVCNEEGTVCGVDRIALPRHLLSAQGHRVNLTYINYGNGRLLSSIDNADGTRLLNLVRDTDSVSMVLHPGSPYEALFTMRLRDGWVKVIELPTDNLASWRFDYKLEAEGTLRIIEVQNPVGRVETLSYSEIPHYVPGGEGRTLARVATHRNDPGNDEAVTLTHYSYSKDHHNFLGFGSNVPWRPDGMDNLYRAGEDYTYSTVESLGGTSSDNAIRHTTRTFNRFHLLILEETVQNDNVLRNETAYHLLPGAEFEHQPPYCQLPKTTSQTWYSQKNPAHSRTDTVTTTYDNFGNLLKQVNANNVTETSTWYKAEGEDGCPPDPQKFVRSLKDKTITPAPSDYGQAPTLRTRYTYTEQSGLSGNGPWLAVGEETLVQVVNRIERELQKTKFTYIDAPGDPFEHGRKLQDEVTLNGETTTTAYDYSKARHARTGEAVLHTVNPLTGFDGEKKVITLKHSLINGEPLNTHDDNNVVIDYIYDALVRLDQETVAPGTPYEASRKYSYFLTSAVGERASQTVIDVKSVETIAELDGNNRVIREIRRDADALGGDATEYREIYLATYNHLDQLSHETVIDWEKAENVRQTSFFKYDDWGELCSEERPDGVVEHTVSDPITLTVSHWLEGMGKTVTTNNLFDKPDRVVRINLAGETISEHTYHYDGMGRLAEEYDAANNRTRYEYDDFDRMIRTILPDGSVVEREYAPHSSEDLQVKISVNGAVLGMRRFDGLDRMVESITGGRLSEYSYHPGQSQPKKVKRPTGVETDYDYMPALGEDPVRRVAKESIAIFNYDPENARLSGTEEVDQEGVLHTLKREYFSTGEIKSESRGQGDEVPLEMLYEYSRQARLISYQDVLGQVQDYEYNERAQLICTSLGTTTSTFAYNDLAQLKSILTIDGSQQLKTDLEYDDFGREILRRFDLGNQVIQTLEQTYDEVDRLVQRTLMQGVQTLRDERYGYDVRGRLVNYSCTGSQCPEDPYGKIIEQQLFGYDAIDNMEFVETTFEGGQHTIYFEYLNTLDPCQLTGLTNYLDPARPNDPLYPDKIDFCYDDDGNLVKDELGRTLAYDSLGRLMSVSAPTGEPGTDYQYDSLDELDRLNTSSGSEQRYYKRGKLTTQIKSGDSSTFFHAEGAALAEIKEGAGPKS